MAEPKSTRFAQSCYAISQGVTIRQPATLGVSKHAIFERLDHNRRSRDDDRRLLFRSDWRWRSFAGVGIRVGRISAFNWESICRRNFFRIRYIAYFHSGSIFQKERNGPSWRE